MVYIYSKNDIIVYLKIKNSPFPSNNAFIAQFIAWMHIFKHILNDLHAFPWIWTLFLRAHICLKMHFWAVEFVWDYFNWSLYEIKIIFEWCYLYPYKVMLWEQTRIYLYHLHNFPNESFLKGQKKIYTPRTHWPLLNSLLGARCNKYLFSKKNLKSIILFWVTSLSKSTK